MSSGTSETVHATTVAIGGRAVMIEGRSGSGKSDLALRLIDRGATLVSDDYTIIVRRGEELVAHAPAAIAGRLEVRGLGIIDLPHIREAAVALAVRLDVEVDRMPECRHRQIVGVKVRELAVSPFEASAPVKVELALKQGAGA